MTTGLTVIAGILFLLVYMALALGLRSFCSWAVRQAEAREAAASFETDFIVEAADVAPAEAETDDLLSSVREANAEATLLADAERTVLAEDMLVELDGALAHLAALRRRA